MKIYTPAERERILESFKAIGAPATAEKFKVNVSSVYAWAAKAGVKVGGRGGHSFKDKAGAAPEASGDAGPRLKEAILLLREAEQEFKRQPRMSKGMYLAGLALKTLEEG